MNRRQFLERSGQALATIPLVSLGSRFDLLAQGAAPSIPAPVLERLGITTVCFRERFPATRTKGAAAPPEGDLTLLTAPKFIADQLGLHNVEVHDRVLPQGEGGGRGGRVDDLEHPDRWSRQSVRSGRGEA
jgi:hypothetical protein